jgi:hypothetical protein
MEKKGGSAGTPQAVAGPAVSSLKVRRHSRSQSDLSQLDVRTPFHRGRWRVCFPHFFPSLAQNKKLLMRGTHSPALMRPPHAQQKGSPLHSPLMQVSPRSPRPHMAGGGRPSREQRQKKRNDAAVAERVFGQLAMAGNNNNTSGSGTNSPAERGGSPGRRYVDTSPGPADSAKRSHRRAVSLSFRAEEQPGGQAMMQGTLPGSETKHRPARRLHSTMRPSLTPSSAGFFGPDRTSGSGPTAVQAAATRRKAERFLSGKLVDFSERLGHRRANSWDARDEADELALRRKSEMTTLEVALATKKAELAAKEKILLERQSRQEAELISLAGATNMERDLKELLRLNRKLKVRSCFAVSFVPYFFFRLLLIVTRQSWLLRCRRRLRLRRFRPSRQRKRRTTASWSATTWR